jgi:HTH-type transcriptional regulator, glycine betaine synthesis regulator
MNFVKPDMGRGWPESIAEGAAMLDSKLYRDKRHNDPEGPSTEAQLEDLTREFVNNLGRIADFFGFNRLMGQLYAILFLSPEPLTLDDMVEKLKSSKGNVSINIRALERWGLVRQIYKLADRKNYYEAETDIWKAVSGILQERERKESRQMVTSLSHSISMLEQVSKKASGDEAAATQFYLERMEVLRRLFQFGDTLLDMMVRGGAVDFGSASKLAQGQKTDQPHLPPTEELDDL